MKVQIPSPSTSSQHYQNLPLAEDVHICGMCKEKFSDIALFLEHKRQCLSLKVQQTAQLSVQPQTGGVSYITPHVKIENGPLNCQYVLEGGNIVALQSKTSTGAEDQGLRPQLVGVSAFTQELLQNDLNNGSSLVLPQYQPIRREFQTDEEDVATLLANQLTNEIVPITQTQISPSRAAALLGLNSLTEELLVDDGRGSVDLGLFHAPETTSEPVKEAQKISLPSDKNSLANDGKMYLVLPTVQNSKLNADEQEKVKKSGLQTIEQKWSLDENLSKDCQEQALMTVGGLPPGTRIIRGRKQYRCPHQDCSFTTFYAKDMVRHYRKHTGERPFFCQICGRSFSRADKLQSHFRIHTGEKPHHCQLCDYSTIDSGSLRKHMRIHNDERPYKCQICPYRSRDSSQLTVHLRTHTGDNPFMCQYEGCSSTFKTSSDLKRHFRIHTGEKPYKCDSCSYRCAIKSNLKVHMKYNHAEGKSLIGCTKCETVSHSKRSAKQHFKSHCSGGGDNCDSSINSSASEKSFETSASQKTTSYSGTSHYEYISDSSAKPQYSPETSSKESYTSSEMDVTSESSPMRHSHKSKQHDKKSKFARPNKTAVVRKKSIHPNSKTPANTKPFCVKSFSCSYCDAAFVREDSLRSHLRVHKRHSKALNDKKSFPKSDSKCEIIINSLKTKTSMRKSDNGPKSPVTDESDLSEVSKGSETQTAEGVKNENNAKVTPKPRGDIFNCKNVEGAPVLFYLQNGNVDNSASLLTQAPVLFTNRAGQLLTLPSVEYGVAISDSLQPSIQYLVSAMDSSESCHFEANHDESTVSVALVPTLIENQVAD